jgi:nicotinate-nucleotide--dimethylbenzimidazole phosphoribosyltransferase
METRISQSSAFALDLKLKIDSKTKPLGALGRVEELAARIARLQGTLSPRMQSCRLVIFAGDHGIAEEGVSAYPQVVTRQMVLNFLAGGAAANVFARTLGVDVAVVDCGVAGAPISDPTLVLRRCGAGTANSAFEPAMTEAQCRQALDVGGELTLEGGYDALCYGEMGIANTSAATLIAHKLTGIAVADLVGRGTGLDDQGVERKRLVLERAAARTPDRLNGPTALREYGGFEIAAITGAMIAAAEARRLVLVDGYIASVAALVAIDSAPHITGALVFAHCSAEHGHAAVLEALGVEPLLDLGMRLGEGTGALLAWPLVKAAAAMLNDMASFDSAQVSGPA